MSVTSMSSVGGYRERYGAGCPTTGLTRSGTGSLPPNRPSVSLSLATWSDPARAAPVTPERRGLGGEMDIGRLIEQLKAGDDTAGPVLVSILAPRLLGYAEMIANDLPLADREQAVEQAIETAIRRIDRYDPNRGTFPGWVRPFVRHAVSDWRRDHPTGAPGQIDERTDTAVLEDNTEEEHDDPVSA